MVGGEEAKHLVGTLLGELSIGKRWLVSATMIVFLVVVVLVGDYYTGYTHYRNLEKKVALLHELNTLTKDGVGSQAELQQIFRNTVQELGVQNTVAVSSHRVVSPSSLAVWKFLSAGFWGWFVIIASVLNKADRKAAYGALLFVVFSGVIGVVIPILWRPEVNIIGIPILQVVLLFAFLNHRTQAIERSNREFTERLEKATAGETLQ